MKRGPMAWRVGGAVLGLVGFLAFSYLLMPHTVQLSVQLPPDAKPVSSLDLRVVEVEKGAEAYRGRRTRLQPGRSMLFDLRLSRGRYRLTGTSPDGQGYEAMLDYGNEDFVELALKPR